MEKIRKTSREDLKGLFQAYMQKEIDKGNGSFEQGLEKEDFEYEILEDAFDDDTKACQNCEDGIDEHEYVSDYIHEAADEEVFTGSSLYENSQAIEDYVDEALAEFDVKTLYDALKWGASFYYRRLLSDNIGIIKSRVLVDKINSYHIDVDTDDIESIMEDIEDDERFYSEEVLLQIISIKCEEHIYNDLIETVVGKDIDEDVLAFDDLEFELENFKEVPIEIGLIRTILDFFNS